MASQGLFTGFLTGLAFVVALGFPPGANAEETAPAAPAAIAAEPTLPETPATPAIGAAMHGTPKYTAGFTHFDYVNPDAPKGGKMQLASHGTFDTLNGFIIKGSPAPQLGNIYQTLMSRSNDEAFTQYGNIAETIEMPEDRSWVAFNLRKEARWSDGKPLTSADVVWTFNTLMKEGHPFYRAYYASVKEVTADDPYRVKFTFGVTGNRELPLILGEMTVLPKHYWEGRKFDATTLDFPVGSGPYKIKSIDPGRRITYERVKDWWAKDLPVNKGMYNFDTLVYDLYLDETVLLQAFFSGEYDFRSENMAKAWATDYTDQDPVKKGFIKKEEIDHDLPVGMQGFVFNTRRAIFADPAVREALNYALDFEWSNKQMAFGAYKRTNSYFENSELGASGLPKGQEAEILEGYRGKVPHELFFKEYENPVTSGSGNDIRDNLGKARKLLEEAGWTIGAGRVLVKHGQTLKFEILLHSDTFERWVAPFVANLKKLGVLATMRTVDTSQYQNRMDSFDFDMTIGSFPQSLSPGNEQLDFWGSEKADIKGSRNIIGIKNPVVDDLIKRIIFAKDREGLIAATRSLDRVLLWNHYVIPQWHIDYYRIAYWDKFGRPPVGAKYDLGIPETWWYDPAKAEVVDKRAEKKQ